MSWLYLVLSPQVAWCKRLPDGLLPHKVHMPYWSKKGMADITIVPMHTHAENVINQLTGDNEHMQTQLEVLRSGGTSSSTAAAAGDKGAGKRDKGAGDKGAGDKGTGTVQKRGGWMAKMAKLIKAIQAEDWNQMYALTDEYMGDYLLKKLVDQH